MTTLTPEKEQLAIFLATPRAQRPYTSLEKFAEALRRDHATIYRWKKELAVRQRVQEIIAEAAGSVERLKSVIDVLYETATARSSWNDEPIVGSKPDVKAMQLYLGYLGIDTTGKPREIPVVVDDIEDLTDEQLADAVDQIAALKATRALRTELAHSDTPQDELVAPE